MMLVLWPPRPPMGGLLAELSKKKPMVDADSGSSAPPKPAMGGLLAEIQKKGSTNDDAPDSAQTTKKRGLLAALTGRRK